MVSGAGGGAVASAPPPAPPCHHPPAPPQTILAGTVPVYIGAPNIHAFSPGPRSFVHIRDFSSGRQLWEYLQLFAVRAGEGASHHCTPV